MPKSHYEQLLKAVGDLGEEVTQIRTMVGENAERLARIEGEKSMVKWITGIALAFVGAVGAVGSWLAAVFK